jgi:hypothetical protein
VVGFNGVDGLRCESEENRTYLAAGSSDRRWAASCPCHVLCACLDHVRGMGHDFNDATDCEGTLGGDLFWGSEDGGEMKMQQGDRKYGANASFQPVALRCSSRGCVRGGAI